MTIEQAIFQADELKPNQVAKAQKIIWLSQLDRRIFKEVISAHEPDADTPKTFAGYTRTRRRIPSCWRKRRMTTCIPASCKCTSTL